MGLDPKRGEPAVPEIDDARVLSGSDDDPFGVGGEAAEMDPRRLVGAVFRPHHRVHGELGRSRPAAEDLDDGGVLVVGHAEYPVCRLRGLGGGHDSAGTAARKERRRASPSAEPSAGSLARSGWGMSPATLPAALQSPAIELVDPFGEDA